MMMTGSSTRPTLLQRRRGCLCAAITRSGDRAGPI
jgi:hypothetical protein